MSVRTLRLTTTWAASAAAALLLSTAGCTTYSGTSYAPTERVDVYRQAADITRPYEVMGESQTVAKDYIGDDIIESRLKKDAMARGADAVLIVSEELIDAGGYGIGQMNNANAPSYVIHQGGKLEKVPPGGMPQPKPSGSPSAGIGTDTEIVQKVVKARLLKYK